MIYLSTHNTAKMGVKMMDGRQGHATLLHRCAFEKYKYMRALELIANNTGINASRKII
jgi:hypothetical protein